ncbi:alkaline phosphatase family protein [Microaerobacter geothermalis]|uniref:alkaline phosphatase family protein n=1 Tax=Microaerobacter geothermalis TaxID=674972 RepID=UPI001F225ED9|nr:alkaline phosphatase family protein [Microaerobacter geothermalis]MCF6095137.1 alkaline phosphatase family protein [Microaerobacter geothermalis]
MKKASNFEIVAARLWNVLNEGKTFTPVFVIGVYLMYHISDWDVRSFWVDGITALFAVLPLFAVYYVYDFPIHLRYFLWFPLAISFVLFGVIPFSLLLFSMGLYFFFTVIFWGTIYYHLRIGTTLWNFTRFWKLVLKNSDSTSGNAQEQIPKFLLLLTVLEGIYLQISTQGGMEWTNLLLFTGGIWIYSFLIHYLLFRWKPEEIDSYTHHPDVTHPIAKKVVMVIIDGCRKDRLAEANTPFIDWLTENGTEYTQMETVYPARTVVCFSSMFTGTYPREHGIKSNMVWRLGVRCESIFDSLSKVGKKGRLLGIAHLIDAFGNDVDSVTAVMKNDEADRHIMNRAKMIMEESNPDLLIVQLIATDQTGHSRGALYGEYREKIEEADLLIKEFYQWLNQRGDLEGAVFIVAADHGQSDGIGGHGHLDEGERFVPFIIHGPMIERGKKIMDKRSLVSVAPTLAYLLGAPYPNKSRGSVLIEAIRGEIKNYGGGETA